MGKPWRNDCSHGTVHSTHKEIKPTGSFFNFEGQDQLTKKKDRILIKDLIIYNWKYRNKRSKDTFTVGNIYSFYTNISEGTAFLLQGLPSFLPDL